MDFKEIWLCFTPNRNKNRHFWLPSTYPPHSFWTLFICQMGMEREIRNLMESWLLLIVFPINYLDSSLFGYLRVHTPPHLVAVAFERPLTLFVRQMGTWGKRMMDREIRNLMESWLLLIVFPIDYSDSSLIRHLRIPTDPILSK